VRIFIPSLIIIVVCYLILILASREHKVKTFIDFCKSSCKPGHGCEHRRSAVPISWSDLMALCPKVCNKTMLLPTGFLYQNANQIDKCQGNKERVGQKKQRKEKK